MTKLLLWAFIRSLRLAARLNSSWTVHCRSFVTKHSTLGVVRWFALLYIYIYYGHASKQQKHVDACIQWSSGSPLIHSSQKPSQQELTSVMPSIYVTAAHSRWLVIHSLAWFQLLLHACITDAYISAHSVHESCSLPLTGTDEQYFVLHSLSMIYSCLNRLCSTNQQQLSMLSTSSKLLLVDGMYDTYMIWHTYMHDIWERDREFYDSPDTSF